MSKTFAGRVCELANRQVVAPADGWVLYRGDYLNYGQIVIINAGQDYTILLAGLASVSVDIGQFVLMDYLNKKVRNVH